MVASLKTPFSFCDCAMAQPLKFDVPASLFASLSLYGECDLLEGLEKDEAGASECAFNMLVNPSGEFTAVLLSSLSSKGLKLLV